jgi:hypothetical protein
MSPGSISTADRGHLTVEDRLLLLESEMVIVVGLVEKMKQFLWGFGGVCASLAIIWSFVGTIIVVKVGELSSLSLASARTETKLDHFIDDQKRQDAEISRALARHDARESEEIDLQRAYRSKR